MTERNKDNSQKDVNAKSDKPKLTELEKWSLKQKQKYYVDKYMLFKE